MERRRAPLITLITDFGSGPYVAEVKGVLLGMIPDVRIVDVTHDIAPQDIEQAAWELAQIVPAFPDDTLHLVVVDPGVGTARDVLAGTLNRHRFIAPDNGLLSVVLDRADEPGRWVALSESRYWRGDVSATFHGRDIMAPVAAHWLSGTPLQRFGPSVEYPQRLPSLWPAFDPHRPTLATGRVARVDRFGNLITNIPARRGAWNIVGAATVRLVGGERPRWVRTYSEAASGELVALIGSSGYVELAVNGGSAERQLGAGRGLVVEVEV